MDLSAISKEIRKKGISKIAREAKISRSHLYEIIEGRTNPSLETLEKLLFAIGFAISIKRKSQGHNLQNYDFLKWSLAYWGAPLMADESFSQPASLHETLLAALKMGEKDATINSILPSFINLNLKKIKWEKLLLEEINEQYLGYHLNLLFDFTNDLEYAKWMGKIADKRSSFRLKRLISDGTISKFEERKFSRTDNLIAQKWKLKTSDSLESTRARFKKWQQFL